MSKIKNNTSGLQAILDAVNELPNAGSGGGGGSAEPCTVNVVYEIDIDGLQTMIDFGGGVIYTNVQNQIVFVPYSDSSWDINLGFICILRNTFTVAKNTLMYLDHGYAYVDGDYTSVGDKFASNNVVPHGDITIIG